MDTPTQNPAPVPQPAAPAPVAPTPVPVAATPTPAVTPPPVATPTTKPATAPGVVPKNEGASTRRFLIGCLSAFGCSIFLFLGVIFAFLGFGSTNNPIFSFLGVPPGEVVNVLITLINFIFLFLVFVSFIFVVIGFFKRATAKKDDAVAKKKGTVMTFVSLAVLIIFIVLWVVAYFFLAPKRTLAIKVSPITTIPEKTINLTAPVTIKFDGSKAPVNKTQFDLLSYEWDFGDGATAKGPQQTHTYEELGDFKVILNLKVKEKATGKEQEVPFTRDVTIQNILARVVIKAVPAKGVAPLKVALDGSESKSENGEITAYAWDLDDDGEFNDGAEATVEKTFAEVGSHVVHLKVTDSTGAAATGDLTIEATVPDTPEAVIKIEGGTGDGGTTLATGTAYIFNGGKSTSPTGTVEKFAWDFGDGSTATTRSATHTYKDAGEYEVVLKVTDSSKKSGSKTVKVTAGAPNVAPLVSLKTTPAAKEGIIEGQAPFEVIFDAKGSTDTNDNIVEYAWDFDGDGKTDDANALATYVFTTAGTYKTKITVTDAGELKTTSEVVVKVAAPGLSARVVADPVAGSIPLTVKFDASSSSYENGTIVSYEWEFGDGGKPRVDVAQVAHQYTTIGTFNVKVTAIASDGKRASTTIPINVRPVELRACFDPSQTSGVTPLTVVFDPACSTGTVVSYKWKFTPFATSTDRKPTYIFSISGTYDVELEVIDNEKVVNTFTKQIIVTDPE